MTPSTIKTLGIPVCLCRLQRRLCMSASCLVQARQMGLCCSRFASAVAQAITCAAACLAESISTQLCLHKAAQGLGAMATLTMLWAVQPCLHLQVCMMMLIIAAVSRESCRDGQSQQRLSAHMQLDQHICQNNRACPAAVSCVKWLLHPCSSPDVCSSPLKYFKVA